MRLQRLILIVVLVIFVVTSNVQAIGRIISGVSVEAGAFSVKTSKPEREQGSCYAAGIFKDHKVNEHLIVRAQLIYSTASYSLSYQRSFLYGSMSVNEDVSLQTIDLPLTFHFPFPKSRALSVFIGYNPTINLKASRSGEVSFVDSPTFSYEEFDLSVDNIKSYRHALILGFHYSLPLPELSISLDLRLKKHLNNIVNDVINSEADKSYLYVPGDDGNTKMKSSSFSVTLFISL